MREFFTRTGTAALIAGLALAVAGCGGETDTGDEADANLMESNLILDEPANDASAMESIVNVAEPETPVANTAENETDDSAPLGETSGGDTGGNTVDSNVSGM
jgi:hypothetical protein